MLKYVPALVVAATLLLGPLVACAEGVLLGVESTPGPWTLVGGAVMVVGSGLITAKAAGKQSTTINVDIGSGETQRDSRKLR